MFSALQAELNVTLRVLKAGIKKNPKTSLLDIWTYFDQSELKNFKLLKKITTIISAHKVLIVTGSKKLRSFPAAQT